MPAVTRFPVSTATPNRQTVLTAQGVPNGAPVPKRVDALIDDGFELYSKRVDAAGARMEISIEDFDVVYRGEGRNAARTPLEAIFPKAQRLALFAVTIGEAVCSEIRRLFKEGDQALGYTLDTIASAGAEGLADAMARDYQDALLRSGPDGSDLRVLPYSPGYCGWHVSGQARLFEVLQPERIGISLNTSYLMQPLKSVSGVLVAADREIHDFDIDLDFCGDCADQHCRERIRSVLFDTNGGQ
jgi:hypothetical protein